MSANDSFGSSSHLKAHGPCGFNGCAEASTQTLISHHGVRVKEFCDLHGGPALEWWLQASERETDRKEEEALGFKEGDIDHG